MKRCERFKLSNAPWDFRMKVKALLKEVVWKSMPIFIKKLLVKRAFNKNKFARNVFSCWKMKIMKVLSFQKLHKIFLLVNALLLEKVCKLSIKAFCKRAFTVYFICLQNKIYQS